MAFRREPTERKADNDATRSHTSITRSILGNPVTSTTRIQFMVMPIGPKQTPHHSPNAAIYHGNIPTIVDTQWILRNMRATLASKFNNGDIYAEHLIQIEDAINKMTAAVQALETIQGDLEQAQTAATYGIDWDEQAAEILNVPHDWRQMFIMAKIQGAPVAYARTTDRVLDLNSRQPRYINSIRSGLLMGPQAREHINTLQRPISTAVNEPTISFPSNSSSTARTTVAATAAPTRAQSRTRRNQPSLRQSRTTTAVQRRTSIRSTTTNTRRGSTTAPTVTSPEITGNLTAHESTRLIERLSNEPTTAPEEPADTTPTPTTERKEEDPGMCSICREDWADNEYFILYGGHVILEQCKHKFHTACIKRVVHMHYSSGADNFPLCPLCRAVITEWTPDQRYMITRSTSPSHSTLPRRGRRSGQRARYSQITSRRAQIAADFVSEIAHGTHARSRPSTAESRTSPTRATSSTRVPTSDIERKRLQIIYRTEQYNKLCRELAYATSMNDYEKMTRITRDIESVFTLDVPTDWTPPADIDFVASAPVSASGSSRAASAAVSESWFDINENAMDEADPEDMDLPYISL